MEMTFVGIDQSIEWSAVTMRMLELHFPDATSRSTKRPTCRSVLSRAAERAAWRVVPVRSLWPTRSTSPRFAKTRSGSGPSTIAMSASTVAASGACSVIGTRGAGSHR